MQRLADAEQQQRGWIDTYQFSLKELKAQVANIQEISDSLPVLCPTIYTVET